MIWYNLSRSDISNTTWKQYRCMVHGAFGIVWEGNFDKSCETRWMVTWRTAGVLEERWDPHLWLASERAPIKLLGNPFMDYWYKSYVLLSSPAMRVHCKFATALGERVLFWGYHWLRGKGGYFLERDSKMERLPPGMRLAQAPEFCLEYLRRHTKLRSKPRQYIQDVIEFAEKHLGSDEVTQSACMMH